MLLFFSAFLFFCLFIICRFLTKNECSTLLVLNRQIAEAYLKSVNELLMKNLLENEKVISQLRTVAFLNY